MCTVKDEVGSFGDHVKMNGGGGGVRVWQSETMSICNIIVLSLGRISLS